MYLSCLMIDVGTNPDRPRPGRLWLRNLYRVHQRLCMAFPVAEHKHNDPQFLAPYQPQYFPLQRHLADRLERNGKRYKELENKNNVSDTPLPEEQNPTAKLAAAIDKAVLDEIHLERSEQQGFLFRIDPKHAGRVMIIVQSAVEPDWDYAFHNARHFLAAAPEIKHFDPIFTAGERLRFRLVANPTRRLHEKSLGRDGQPVAERWVGKRVPVFPDKLCEWLAQWTPKKNVPSGFCPVENSVVVQTGYVYVNKNPLHASKNATGGGQRLFAARYDGLLTVTDCNQFRKTLIQGVGPAKAFGFGLLSLGRVKQ